MDEMLKHSILFAGAILITAFLLSGVEEGTVVVTTVLVPLWYITSLMIERREKGQKSDSVDYI